MHPLLLTVVTCLALVSAGARAQYLEPEDVLTRDRNAVMVPRNRRQAEEAAARQDREKVNQQRPTAYEWWTRSSSSAAATTTDDMPVTNDDGLHAAPPEEPATDTSNLDPILRRLLDRLQDQNSGPQLSGQDTHSTALHSGAPLAGSGPAETATVAVMLGSMGWTLWKARKKEAMMW